MALLGGMLFRWVNPKARLLVLSANVAVTRQDRAQLLQTIWISLVFLAVSPPCVLPWAMLGSAAAWVLGSPGKLRWFNRMMAGLLVASMLPVALGI
jgi:threonine/homoserine/homoserine lactone efflux protein